MLQCFALSSRLFNIPVVVRNKGRFPPDLIDFLLTAFSERTLLFLTAIFGNNLT